MFKNKKLLFALTVTVVVILAMACWIYLRSTSTKSLSTADIKRLSQTVKLEKNDSQKILGTFNNKTVVASRWCSDVCPSQEYTVIIYKDVDQAECASLNGKVLKDIAWGGYIGCYPE